MQTNTSNIDITFNITEVFVRPRIDQLDLNNVVEKVIWKAKLSRNGVSTIAYGEVVLPSPDKSEGFVNVEQLSEQQLIDWMLNSLGGDVFLEGLKMGHAPHLDKLEHEANLVRWTKPLVGQDFVEQVTLSTDQIDTLLKNITNT